MEDTLREQYIAKVIEHGKGRRKNFGRDFHDDDYLAGAMVAFEVFGNMGQLPAGWVFGVMSNNSPITGPIPPRMVRCAYPDCKEEEEVHDERQDVPLGWHVLRIGQQWSARPGSPLAFCNYKHLRRAVMQWADLYED